VWGNFDRLQRKAAIPIHNDLGPGQYEIRKNNSNFAALIARPEVLERILKKQERERNTKLAAIKNRKEKEKEKEKVGKVLNNEVKL
jgi:hypothetical protein